MSRVPAVLFALTLALTASSITRAEAPLEGRARNAEAERLFEEAKALLAKDDWIAGCALFEASAKLSEVAPVVVKVARCRVHEGRLAQAIDDYERALGLHPWADLERLIRGELEGLYQRTPSIKILVDQEGVTIHRNGRRLSPVTLRQRLFTDVGVAERFTAEGPGLVGASYEVKASAEGEALEVRVALEKVPVPPPPPPPPTSPRVIAGWAAAGAGALALGLGAGFGAQYLSRRGSLFDGCTGTLADGRHVCPSATTQRYDDVVSARNRSIALLGGGATLAAAGVVLLVVGRPAARDATAPTLSLAPAASPTSLGLLGAATF